jgi:hypothetical protein
LLQPKFLAYSVVICRARFGDDQPSGDLLDFPPPWILAQGGHRQSFHDFTMSIFDLDKFKAVAHNLSSTTD